MLTVAFAILARGLPKKSDRMTPMSVSAKRLGTAVLKRRKELDLNQRGVADAGGPSDTTLSKLENGAVKVVAAATLRRLDAALQWPAGTARAIYEGKTLDATVQVTAATTASATVDHWSQPSWMSDVTYRRIMRDMDDYFHYKVSVAAQDYDDVELQGGLVIAESSDAPLEPRPRAGRRQSPQRPVDH